MSARVAACGLAAVAAAALAPAVAPAAPVPATIEVDATATLGPTNRDLVGLGWHPGGPPLADVAGLTPRLVRVDAGLERLSPAPGVLNLAPLLDAVREVRSVGAEPLVILSYMPAWLGAPKAFGRDPTKVPPADADAWERLVHDVVLALATAPAPARRFEAWNEPDVPIFWQDTPTAWSAMVARTARAVARVEAETGLDLAFGGPATAVPDPVYLAAFLQAVRDPTLPLEFVSWHYYANTPFLGPDGNEFPALAPLHPAVGRPNPLAGPGVYGPQVPLMRQWTAALLAGSGRPPPEMVIDEWNLSGGGFDRRHDTHEGAAFAIGALVEMQRAGLDASAFFQATDAPAPRGPAGPYGGHGVLTRDGTRKPVWWALWLWQQQADDQLAVVGAPPGVWVAAARGQDRLSVLAASFSASTPRDHDLRVAIGGLAWQPGAATLRRIDAAHADASAQETLLPGTDNTFALSLPAQGVVLMDVRPAVPNRAPAGLGAAQLPATGGPPEGVGWAFLVAGAGLVAITRAMGSRRTTAVGSPRRSRSGELGQQCGPASARLEGHRLGSRLTISALATEINCSSVKTSGSVTISYSTPSSRHTSHRA